MTISISTDARDACVDAVAALIDGGAGAGKIVIQDATTPLVSIALSDPAMGASSGGTATGASFPKNAAATDDGTADNFEVQDSDDTMVVAGSVGLDSSGADMELDNVNIASGQTVTLTSFTMTMPASA